MKFYILIDNTPDIEGICKAEHGLSIYFEFEGYRYLFDVGSTDLFYHNAQKLGIDVSEIDYLILSHGHSDHTGGLAHFISHNTKARIIASANIQGKSFYSNRLQGFRDISINQQLLGQFYHRFIFIEQDLKINNGVGILSDISKVHPIPQSNKRLRVSDLHGERVDDFNHEIALYITTNKGTIVLSGCSHRGLLNILDACQQQIGLSKIIACIGGTHLSESDTENQFETEEEIEEIGNYIVRVYPEMQLFTGHCTGTSTLKYLKNSLGENLKGIYCGEIINFENRIN